MVMSDKQRKAMFAKMDNSSSSMTAREQREASKGGLSASQQKRIQTMKNNFAKGNDDPIASRELLLFIENDRITYNQSTQPVWRNLQKRIKKGTYNRDGALLAFKNVADVGNRRYQTEVAPTSAFTSNVRDHTAKELLEDFEDEVNINA